MTIALALDPLPVWIAAAAIATLFAHAALVKWADLALFEQQLAAYGVPAALLAPAARLLPAAESLTALLLLSPLRPWGASLGAALLLAYAAAMAWQRWQGHELDCGCGGDPLPLSWALVLRNAGLAGLAALAGAPLAPRSLGWADFTVLAGALALAALLYAAFNQILRHRAGGPAQPSSLRRTRWTH